MLFAAVVPPLSHHQLLLFVVQLGLLLVVARSLGELARKLNLPSVVGELLAGVVLGPSLLGALAPGAFEWLFPAEAGQVHLLEVVGWLGVLMLLILTGLETDVQLIMRRGRSAAAVSLGGIIVPFAFGFGVAQMLPDQFIAAPDQRLVFSLFIGTAMSISAIPVIAKVLVEMGVVRRDIGQLTLAAGMIDDTIGWIMLSVVAALARGGGVSVTSVGGSLLAVLGFLAFSFTIGRRLVSFVMRRIDNAIPGDSAMLTALIALALAFGALTHSLGLEAVLGAFVVGILVGQVRRFDHRLRHQFEVVALAIFAPVFFASSGLRVDLAALFNVTVLLVGLLVLGIAILGKFVGAYAGAKLSGLGHWEALSLGAGMNARGAMEIIVATIGLSLGILTPQMYTIILMVAIVTSLMAPPLLRWTLSHVAMSDEERDRLEAEERARTSFVGNLTRVLLPTRGGGNDQIAAQLVARIVEGADIEVTTMLVGDVAPANADGDGISLGQEIRTAIRPMSDVATRERLGRVEQRLADADHADVRRLIRVSESDTADAVLAEAQRDYDLLVLGAEERPGRKPEEPLFSATVDKVITESPCPFMVVSSRIGDNPDKVVQDIPLGRILLPISAAAGRDLRAAEVAFGIARRNDVTVDVVHVISVPQLTATRAREGDLDAAKRLGREMVTTIADLGATLGVTTRKRVVLGEHPESTIVELSEEYDTDLVVLSADVRPVSERAFLGHRADHVLRYAPCPVVLVGQA